MSNERTIQCTKCGKILKNYYDLDNHDCQTRNKTKQSDEIDWNNLLTLADAHGQIYVGRLKEIIRSLKTNQDKLFKLLDKKLKDDDPKDLFSMPERFKPQLGQLCWFDMLDGEEEFIAEYKEEGDLASFVVRPLRTDEIDIDEGKVVCIA